MKLITPRKLRKLLIHTQDLNLHNLDLKSSAFTIWLVCKLCLLGRGVVILTVENNGCSAQVSKAIHLALYL